jgi:hypothetical protein
MATFAGVVVGDGDEVGVALVLGSADVDALDVGPDVVDVEGADEDDEEQLVRARTVTSDAARTRAVGTACRWRMVRGLSRSHRGRTGDTRLLSQRVTALDRPARPRRRTDEGPHQSDRRRPGRVAERFRQRWNG